MASFDHITPDRSAQLGRALTAAGLVWNDNSPDDPQHCIYTVTDPHGRSWRVGPVTNFQTSRSNPARIWQASCEELLVTTPVLSARMVADRIKETP
ncbi:hypothetical protein [Streptomyces sp. NPDC002559]